jgi:alpha-galactosidase
LYAYILNEYQKTETSWKEEAKKWFAKETPISLERGHEYAAYIANALRGGETFQFNGNVPNKQLITNLPPDVCVEVPVFVDRGGLHPVHVGPLPIQLATLNHLSSSIEEMTVEAAITGDPTLVYYACCYDPLAASVLSLAEIRQMVNDLLAQNQPYLPQFKHYQV